MRCLPPLRTAAAGLVAGLALFASACRMEAHHEVSDSRTFEAPQVRIGEIDWYVDYEAAQLIARAQDKALWVHFGENPG